MKTYLVGGAVRDIRMGRMPKDRDWVVTGSSPEEMLALGYKPVGKDFPVFLHPETNEEYALARTERKTGHGYAGFTFQYNPNITLEEDLGRRDLTINAMAMDDDANLYDPYNGDKDITDGMFRHVNPEAFKEDPVRVLRLARFMARYPRFHVHYTTSALCEEMAESGELKHLVPERVWQELSGGLMEEWPSRMIDTLWSVSALEDIFPELLRLMDEYAEEDSACTNADLMTRSLWAVEKAALEQRPLAVRYAILLMCLTAEEVKTVNERLKVPSDCRDLAVLFQREYKNAITFKEMDAEQRIDFLKRVDSFRNKGRFQMFLQAFEAAELFDQSVLFTDHSQSGIMARALEVAESVDCGEIAKQCASPKEIPEAITAARVRALREEFN